MWMPGGSIDERFIKFGKLPPPDQRSTAVQVVIGSVPLSDARMMEEKLETERVDKLLAKRQVGLSCRRECGRDKKEVGARKGDRTSTVKLFIAVVLTALKLPPLKMV